MFLELAASKGGSRSNDGVTSRGSYFAGALTEHSYSVAVAEPSENVNAERRPRWRTLLPSAVGAGLAVLVLGVAAAGGALPSCTNAAWGCERAHDPPGFAGSNTAIAFDSMGGAWVSFRDQDAQALMVARYLGSGGDCAGNEAWDCTVVDDPDGHDVGYETDIAFTADGTAWVSYQPRPTTCGLLTRFRLAPGAAAPRQVGPARWLTRRTRSAATRRSWSRPTRHW